MTGWIPGGPRPPGIVTNRSKKMIPRIVERVACRRAGTSLLELTFVVAVMATLTGIAVPALFAGLDHTRTAAAARYLGSKARLARMQAVARSAAIGIRFEKYEASYRFALYVDGNFNGIRTADIGRGIDRMISPYERIEDQFPGVTFGIVDGVPDVGGAAGGAVDPIRLGRSDIMTFTAAGTATSGTVYIRSQKGHQFAVRILGATGRTRVLEFDMGAGTWTER